MYIIGKKLAVLTFVITCFSFGASAQNNALKINVISPAIKTFNIQYEHKLSSESSFQIGYFYCGYDALETDYSGYGVTPEYRLYLSETREALNGIFIAPFLRYQEFKLTDPDGTANVNLFGGGVIFGRQWIFKEKLSMEMFVGPSYSTEKKTITSGIDDFDDILYTGYGIRAGSCLGLAF